MIFYTNKKLKPGTTLEIGKHNNFQGVKDKEGINHEIPAYIIREATKEEFIAQFADGEMYESTKKNIEYPETNFYEVSLD